MRDGPKSVTRCRQGVIAFLVLIAVLASAECVARYFGCPQPYSALFAYDDELGYRPPAGSQVSFPVGEHLYTVVFDKDGIADKAGIGAVEIAILGDGVIAGLELPSQDRIANQISKKLDGKSVLNIGVTGYGTIQQALLLEEWLQQGKIKPKVVFLVFNLANDFIDDIREWDGPTVPNVSLNDGTNQVLPPILPPLQYQIAARMWRQSAIAGCLAIKSNHTSTMPVSTTTPLLDLVNEIRISDSPRGVAGTRVGFERLLMLSSRFGFKILGTVWKDPRELAQLDTDSIELLTSKLKTISSPISWFEVKPITNRVLNEQWDAAYLISGTRHGNALAVKLLTESFYFEYINKLSGAGY
jgi:hypothetical protein